MTVNVCFTSQELILYFVFIFHRDFQLSVVSGQNYHRIIIHRVLLLQSQLFIEIINKPHCGPLSIKQLFVDVESGYRDSPLKQCWNSPNKQSSLGKYNSDIKLFLLLIKRL